MSASDSKPRTTGPTLPLAPQAATQLDSSAGPSTIHLKEEIEARALERLRQFFLLLDEWDRQNG
jgi:hypothetical protein